MARASGRIRTTPRDVRVRERLREAQQQEAQAMAAVCAAQHALDKACTKRDAAIAAAAAVVDRAHGSVSAAQAALVMVSGLDRAAVLLGMGANDLRRKLSNGHTAETRARRSPNQPGTNAEQTPHKSA
jgi:hypothetical protein